MDDGSADCSDLVDEKGRGLFLGLSMTTDLSFM